MAVAVAIRDVDDSGFGEGSLGLAIFGKCDVTLLAPPSLVLAVIIDEGDDNTGTAPTSE
jgi:hypothetical protein